MPGEVAAVVTTYVHTRQLFFRYAISCTPFQESQLLNVSTGTFLSSSSRYVPILIARSNNQRFVLLCFPRIKPKRRSQYPRGLRRRSAAARLLRLWFRIPLGAWMSVRRDYCVLSGRSLCDELITRPKESYRLCFVVV
jgi:hypothetical protein